MAILTEKQAWRRRTPEPGRRRKRTLTPNEQTNVLRAIEWLRVKYRSPRALADAIGMTVEALQKATSPGRPPTRRLAMLAAYAGDVEAERVLAGAWPGEECPWCGSSIVPLSRQLGDQ
jgi:hypothetical protein